MNWTIDCPHLFVILTKCFTIPRFVNGKPVNIPGHSVPLAGLGGFILVFGFLAFNGGSQVSTLGLTLIATNSCVGQHISRWRRWHCGLGNREHNLGRLDRGHCCAPPYQVQVDCQKLCKNLNLYSLPEKCIRISTHSVTRRAVNCFFPVPEATGRAWKMELPTHPQWSPCGHGELFIDPDWIISFFLANPCHFIALSVPNCTKNTQPSMT